MQFTFEIPDHLVPSVELYLNANVTTKLDPLTQATRVERNPGHESAEAFITMQLNEVLRQIAERYPTGEVRAKLEEAQRLKDQVKTLAAAQIVKTA